MKVTERIGNPPYRFVGMYCTQNPTPHSNMVSDHKTCAHCDRSLKYIYMLENVDGNVYGLGSTCIETATDLGHNIKREVKASQLRYKKEETLKKIKEIVESLRDALQKYPGLYMRPCPYSSGSIGSYIKWAIGSMNPKALARSTNIIESLKGELVENEKFGYIVVTENTRDYYSNLRNENFDIHREGYDWYFYKVILEKDAQEIEVKLNESYNRSLVYYVRNFEDISKAHKEIKEELTQMGEYSDYIVGHELEGKAIEVTHFMSLLIAESVGLSRVFGNFKILKVYSETAKSYVVDAEYHSGVLSRCGFCGQKLTNSISMISGIGPICAEKNGFPRLTKQNVPEIMRMLEEQNKAVGVLKKIRIHKSQILSILNPTEVVIPEATVLEKVDDEKEVG